jgi:hypothetical protein
MLKADSSHGRTKMKCFSYAQKGALLLPWLVAGCIAAAVIIWVANSPSEESRQRQQNCKSWGITDEIALQRCAKSEQAERVAIAPAEHRYIIRLVATFNRNLSRLASLKTTAPTSLYKNVKFSLVQKICFEAYTHRTGLSRWASENERFVLTGFIVTQTPDPRDSPEWQPRTYELWPGFNWNAKSLVTPIELDIETLGRDEREFIEHFCNMLPYSRCSATIYGRVGTVSQQTDTGLALRGIVADQIDIKPLDPKLTLSNLGNP